MRAVDTNVLVRLILGDNPQQEASARRFIATGAWASVLVLAEAVWTLSATYGRNPARLAAAIEALLGVEGLAIQDADTVAAALERFRARPSLGFSDCLILELARKAGHLPLGTFDRTLGRVDGAHRL
jgi:predicted nucleic acid-binding protein